jgi:putative thioredoxin
MIGLDHAPAAEAALAIVGGVANVIDVDEQGFEAQVLEASRRAPVVVDFWAGWCQPCRVLSPVLERLAEEYEGRFVLAKIDVDANPRLAAAFGIQGIPAVKAFRDGGVVSEFVGVQPEAAIRAFLDDLAPGEDPAAEGMEAEAAGDTVRAEAAYRAVLSEHPGAEAAAAGLARILLSRNDEEGARRVLAGVPRGGEVARVAAELDLRALAGSDGDLAEAASRAVAGDGRAALQGLLDAVAGGRDRDRAREAMLAVFQRLGEDHPLTAEFRPKLARALF